MGRPLARRREIFGWAMFDFAGQAYTLLIITVVFGDLFTRIVVGDAPDYRLGSLLWSVSLATSYLLVVLLAPLAGAVMDHAASRKRFLFASCAAGLSLGACQSGTRTLVGLFTPGSRAGEFFGFWGLTHKLAGASGLLLIDLRTAILVCVLLFALALLASLWVDQARGEKAAEDEDG